MTDTERLDWLQAQLDKKAFTGRCLFRWSATGRGWRLHETSREECGQVVWPSVRAAIDDAMRREQETTA